MAKVDDINIKVVVDGRELRPTSLNRYGDTIEVEAETHEAPEPGRGEVRVVVGGQDVGAFGSPLGGPQEAPTWRADDDEPARTVSRGATVVDRECVGYAEPQGDGLSRDNEANGLRQALREQLSREERLLEQLSGLERDLEGLREDHADLRRENVALRERVRTEEARLRIIRSAMGPNVLPG